MKNVTQCGNVKIVVSPKPRVLIFSSILSLIIGIFDVVILILVFIQTVLVHLKPIFMDHLERTRQEKSFSEEDLKPGIVVSERPVPIFSAEDDIESDKDVSLDEPTSSGVITENTEDLSKAIEHKLAPVPLKLEHIFLVPCVAIDDLLQDLQYLISTVSVPVVNQTIHQVLQEHNLQVDKAVVDELAIFLRQSHPIQTAIREQGPLFTHKSPFFSSKNFLNLLFLYFCTLINLRYATPLARPRKNKVFPVYWILGNLHEGCQSSLSAINLAALIKSSDVKHFGYDKVLEPLIDDLVTLERHGLFIEKLGKTVKGTVQCIVADNLGAHSIAGFVENFYGKYVCRFCTAEKKEYQTQEVGSETFCIRTEELHSAHLQFMKDNDLPHHFGVKESVSMSGRSSAKLLVILSQDDSRKLLLPDGIPESVDELIEKVREAFGLNGRFRLQYQDKDFGDVFVNLTNTRELQSLGT